MSTAIRLITPDDTQKVATIIRTVMTEFACLGEGYSIEDPEVDDMYTAYATERAAFYVVERDGEVLGCGGFSPLVGGTADTCELQKMYFLPELRGHGLGQQLLQHCIQAATQAGYTYMYLETVARMTAANALYIKHGFQVLTGPTGATGHCGCDAFYRKSLA
ncbi:MAG: GNAT family N-acetyltransferase [Bacteroidota bacterium]